MLEHDARAYGGWISGRHDDLYGAVLDTEGAVTTMCELAGGGPVLEFGVGTGRLAIPLAARGLEVHGVDASPEMLALLEAKPGADAVEVTL